MAGSAAIAIDLAIATAAAHSIQRQPKPDQRAATVSAIDMAFPTQSRHAPTHAADAILPGNVPIESKTASVIRDGNAEAFLGNLDFEPNLTCAGMPNHVVQGFLKGQEDAVSHFRIQRMVRQVFGNLEATGYMGKVEETLGEQGVVAGE